MYVTGKQGPGVETQMLYALRVSNGTQLWSAAVKTNPSPLPDQPLLMNGIIYTCTLGEVSALSASNGSKVWKFAAQEDFGLTIAANGQLYINSSSGITTLRASNGALLWKHSIANHSSGMSWTTPELVAGNIVYVSSPDGVIQALDTSDGRLLWRYAIYT